MLVKPAPHLRGGDARRRQNDSRCRNAILADPMIEAAWNQGVEYPTDFRVASESVQRSRGDVDVGSRRCRDLLLVEQKRQVAFENEERLFLVVVHVRRRDHTRWAEFLERGGPALRSRVGGQQAPVGSDMPEGRCVVGTQ